tara:strand:+ start:7804 stop:8070 length:267 start_codon:yes stop_codon:yes gene_type:complete
MKTLYEIDWSNINLEDSYQKSLNILDPYNFETLLLEIHCNIKDSEINEQTVKKQFIESFEAKIREAKEVFSYNLTNLTNKAIKDAKND